MSIILERVFFFNFIFVSLIAGAPAFASTVKMKSTPNPVISQKVLTLEERVAELEANQSLNIFTLSGIFISRFDSIDTDAEKKLQYLRMQCSLNLDANISKNIQFYSRYTTTKFMNKWRNEGVPAAGTSDLDGADNYDSSNVVLEKAYVDLTLAHAPITFSVGRLPTVDGPPSNYWDGRARMGTYPLLTFNAVLDGIAGTYKLDEHLASNEHLALRALYTPFSQYNSGSAGTGGYVTPPKNASGSRLQTLVSLYSLQVDYTLEGLSYANSANYIAQYYQTGELTLGGNLGLMVSGTSFMAEFSGLGDLPIDLSFSYLMTTLRSIGFYGSAGIGFGTNSEDENMFGRVFLLSTRYHMDRWFVGLEWINGSKNNSYYSGASENLTNLYGTRGNAYHLYVTKKMEDYLSLRLGWTQQNSDFTSPSVGVVSQNITSKIETTYLQMRLDF